MIFKFIILKNKLSTNFSVKDNCVGGQTLVVIKFVQENLAIQVNSNLWNGCKVDLLSIKLVSL